MVIKRVLTGGRHKKGAEGEVVMKKELMGRWSSKGASEEVVIKRELMVRWSSKMRWWEGGHQQGAV